MKVIAFNGSPRKDGNTNILINHVFDELGKEGIQTELVQVGGEKIRPCDGCYICAEKKDKRCVLKNDMLNDCIDKIMAAEGVIIGSPAYFACVSTEMKAFIDRVGMVGKFNDDLYKHKVGAAVVAARRAGAFTVCNMINTFLLANQMVIPGSSYMNMAIGWDKGEVEKDEEGIRTMEVLGQNMAMVLKKIHG